VSQTGATADLAPYLATRKVDPPTMDFLLVARSELLDTVSLFDKIAWFLVATLSRLPCLTIDRNGSVSSTPKKALHSQVRVTFQPMSS
jgi:hypothetical protein